jgi:hypothetical protein
LKIGTTSRVLAVLLAASATAAGAAFLRTEPPGFGPNQVLARLPRAASIHSLLRADLDGRGPSEVAAVARIPAFPGAQQVVYTSLIFRYDRLRRAFIEVYRAPTPGRVPFSVETVRLSGGREVVVFSGLNDDGTRAVEAVRLERGAGIRLPDADAGKAASEIPQPVPAVTWRYAVRNGEVVARTSTVRLRVRQTLRVQASGGGPASVVLSDPRMDVMENGFRARVPGQYRIRVVTGLLPVEEAYSLTVLVEP